MMPNWQVLHRDTGWSIGNWVRNASFRLWQNKTEWHFGTFCVKINVPRSCSLCWGIKDSFKLPFLSEGESCNRILRIGLYTSNHFHIRGELVLLSSNTGLLIKVLPERQLLAAYIGQNISCSCCKPFKVARYRHWQYDKINFQSDTWKWTG